MDLGLADDAGKPLTSGARTSAAELRATLRFQLDFVAQGSAGSPFIGPAQALQCADEGTKGLKSEVTEVVLTSTGLFNGRAAGQSLNSFVSCSVENSRAEFPLSQLPDSLKTKTWQLYRLNSSIVLRISPKPADNARQQFQIRLRLANAQELTQSTPDVIWN
ncbi:hypothetical protein [Hymenobacter daecheongensis]|nr:hypothetical protein [Hymenobacter daecheongensis]